MSTVTEAPRMLATDDEPIFEPTGREPPETFVEEGRLHDDSEDRYEVVDGRRVELPPMGYYQSRIASILLAHMEIYAEEHGLGHVVAEGFYSLPRVEPTRKRRPDVAFVSIERCPLENLSTAGEALDVEPDLAIEVVSPSNSADEIVMKVNEYFVAGVREVWVVYSSVEQVYIYQSATQIRVLTRDDYLESAAILRGFRFPVARPFLKKEEARIA